MIERLGPIPDHPLELARWNQRLLAEVTLLIATGRVDRELAGSLRTLVGTSAKLLPPDVIGEVDRLLRQSDQEMKARDTGTPLEEADSDGQHGPSRAVRCAPR